eukprot:TRINITY_DN31133_c0_g1_i1.p1 TRINITY_DN31133_c0_g1~~TRINITY_DN31133_c0_g1_i1.p1  ORF type:complete len:205 (-),score=45.13 TRINITY_DN31133_c0_g1_i1:296-910(-)
MCHRSMQRDVQMSDEASSLFKSSMHNTRQAVHDLVAEYRDDPEFNSIRKQMMEPFRSAARNSMLGFVGSGVAGLGLARYLANPARVARYRPGPMGQFAIVAGAAIVGGRLIYMSSKPTAGIAQLIEGDDKLAAPICRAAASMKPCADDPECRKLMQRGGGRMYPMLSWYEACQQRSAKLGGNAAGAAGPAAFGEGEGGAPVESQ